MITGSQRLSAALNDKECDRIPVFCNLLDHGAKELGLKQEQYYARGENVAEAQLKMREKYGYDNVWSLFYVGREAELMGCREILFNEAGPPNVKDFVIKEFADIEKLEIPEKIETHPAFAEPLRCLQILKKEVGGKYPICAYTTSSMSLPPLLMGMEKYLEFLFTGPEELKKLLMHKCHDFFVKEYNAYRNNGADVFVYANPFGSTDIIPMSFFEKESFPQIQKDLEAVGTSSLAYYGGMARLNRVLNTLLKKTDISCFYLSFLDDFKESCRIINNRALACGVINDIKMFDWSVKQIKEEVKRIISIGKQHGRFLFGTGVMPVGIPEEKIKAMVQAACEYGKF